MIFQSTRGRGNRSAPRGRKRKRWMMIYQSSSQLHTQWNQGRGRKNRSTQRRVSGMHLLDVTLHGPSPDAAEIRRDVRHGSGLRISPGAGTAPSRPGARGPLASFTEPCSRAQGEAARFNGGSLACAGQGGQGNSRARGATSSGRAAGDAADWIGAQRRRRGGRGVWQCGEVGAAGEVGRSRRGGVRREEEEREKML
jgi:hypothetical protein